MSISKCNRSRHLREVPLEDGVDDAGRAVLRDLVCGVESREVLVDREPPDALAVRRAARPLAGGQRRATVREHHRE